jgi:hypothetical protein
MAGQVTVQMLAAALNKHMDECGNLQKETAAALKAFQDRFDGFDKVVRDAWKAISAVVLAVVVAGTSVLVQNWVLHQESQQATLEAANKVVNTPTPTETVILKKLDSLQPSQ